MGSLAGPAPGSSNHSSSSLESTEASPLVVTAVGVAPQARSPRGPGSYTPRLIHEPVLEPHFELSGSLLGFYWSPDSAVVAAGRSRTWNGAYPCSWKRSF